MWGFSCFHKKKCESCYKGATGWFWSIPPSLFLSEWKSGWMKWQTRIHVRHVYLHGWFLWQVNISVPWILQIPSNSKIPSKNPGEFHSEYPTQPTTHWWDSECFIPKLFSLHLFLVGLHQLQGPSKDLKKNIASDSIMKKEGPLQWERNPPI